MSVAKSYAKALYETAIAQTNGHSQGLAKLDEQLESFSKLLASSKDLHTALCGPIATAKEKTAIVEALAKKGGIGETLTRFLVLLANRDRLAALDEIVEAFSNVRVQSEGGVIGELVVADPPESLGAQDVDSLTRAFTKKLGKKVHFRVSSDPQLLAGMKVTLGGVTYDGTLRSQLQRLRDQVSCVGS